VNNQKIIDSAPKGENPDVVDITGAYFDEHCNHLNSEGFWSELDITPVGPRSLADIKRIVELELMLIHRTKEVGNWILRYDKSVNKQREIIHGQKMRITELELGARRLLDASTLESQENAMAELEELLEEQAK